MNASALRVAVVDDEMSIRMILGEVLREAGYDVREFEAPPPCIAVVEQGQIDLVISDINMPEMNGLELLRAVKGIDDAIAVIMMTSDARLESAVEATRGGATDYLQKPFDDLEVITATVAKAAAQVMERRREKAIVSEHTEQNPEGFRFAGTLEETPLAQGLQVLASMGRDGDFEIVGPPTGTITLAGGKVVHAKWGDLEREKAIYRLIRTARGAYRFKPATAAPAQITMDSSVEGVVLEGLSRKDEFEALSGKMPKLDGKWVMTTTCQSPIAKLAPWLVLVLASLIKRSNPLEALNLEDYYDIDVLRGLHFLWQLGVIKPE